ncbi:MAG: ribulose-phosphate 3-epimerase [Planctomycetia bacterium]
MSMHPVRIAPSMLASDFSRLGAELARAEAAGADWHHVDVMDGHFVPNLTIGAPVVAALHRVARVPLDVHLMITEPLRYAPDFAKAGAHVLTFHIETCANEAAARAVVRGFRKLGIERVGVSLNPDTEVERVAPILDDVDLVLVMSVFPGFGGQKFMPQVLEKGQRLREAGFDGLLEIDGGVNRDTITTCAGAGFDSFVMGSALYGAADMGLELAHCRAQALRARGTNSRHGSP